MATGLEKRINTLAEWVFEAGHLVVFTGAGISTESGLDDFRGPDGVWTRQSKGLPAKSIDFASAEPNAGHLAITELQRLGKLAFLISQNVDNLHLKSGIRPELIAELHGNITKLRCQGCEFLMDNVGDMIPCPICGGQVASSVVDFGQSLPQHDLEDAYAHSKQADLFLAVGSTLTVTPAADMPRVALRAGARLVIINQGETPLDSVAHLRFDERISDVLPPAVERLKEMMQNS
ncbi:MAG: NAD-dependent deacetylase [Dehalococcoidia bacterium]|nr:NAD-dependent deacetylase [Dehalococcoidia bacterium]